MSVRSFSDTFDDSWILLGEMNNIGTIEEQWGSERANTSTMEKFVYAYSNCGLLDLELSGPRFTWCR